MLLGIEQRCEREMAKKASAGLQEEKARLFLFSKRTCQIELCIACLLWPDARGMCSKKTDGEGGRPMICDNPAITLGKVASTREKEVGRKKMRQV